MSKDGRVNLDTDGPFVVIVDTEYTGELFFGPYRSAAQAERCVRRFQRHGVEDYAIRSLQPGGYSVEWAKIAGRTHMKASWRCALLGHAWGQWIDGRWLRAYVVAERFVTCRRCGAEYPRSHP